MKPKAKSKLDLQGVFHSHILPGMKSWPTKLTTKGQVRGQDLLLSLLTFTQLCVSKIGQISLTALVSEAKNSYLEGISQIPTTVAFSIYHVFTHLQDTRDAHMII